MTRSTAGSGILVLCLTAITLTGCLQSAPPKPTAASAEAITSGPARAAELQQEIAKLQQEEQWTQDQINQTVLELQGSKLLGKSSRDSVDLADGGRNSADMTAQYEYKNRIKNQRVALEKELSQIEQALSAGGGGGGGGGGGY